MDARRMLAVEGVVFPLLKTKRGWICLATDESNENNNNALKETLENITGTDFRQAGRIHRRDGRERHVRILVHRKRKVALPTPGVARRRENVHRRFAVDFVDARSSDGVE